jgi:hypothetical protein
MVPQSGTKNVICHILPYYVPQNRHILPYFAMYRFFRPAAEFLPYFAISPLGDMARYGGGQNPANFSYEV